MKENGGEAAIVREVAASTGASPAAPPLPVLAYADVRAERRSWTRRPIWAQLSIPVAALYASTTVVLTLAFLGGDNPQDNIRMMLASLAFTAPLGIGAFIVGVLGQVDLRVEAGRPLRRVVVRRASP